ncbi:hypothetical protein ES319_A01G026000v1 [Gossypium barbadense]|uniref:C2H2-type domain-containing protein n=1 Tax=Gossypium barbadense TaxID=3634 RepID=A0A5J5WT09_GOSBA|nr:hypothetical protein ES319_A01G026000v1 [Gossypium barbadense]
MERKTAAIKDQTSCYSKSNNKVKESSPWSSCNNQGFGSGGEDYLSGFSWPPRSYTCSFCKREFRSAQALGGHMNVHRRDRARLRQSPPPPPKDHHHHHHGQPPFLNLNLNPNPNPNPNFSPPSSLTLSTFPPPSPSLSPAKKWLFIDPLNSKPSDSRKGVERDRHSSLGSRPILGVKELKDYVTLDLEIGLVNDSKQDLDLELRLGYS